MHYRGGKKSIFNYPDSLGKSQLYTSCSNKRQLSAGNIFTKTSKPLFNIRLGFSFTLNDNSLSVITPYFKSRSVLFIPTWLFEFSAVFLLAIRLLLLVYGCWFQCICFFVHLCLEKLCWYNGQGTIFFTPTIALYIFILLLLIICLLSFISSTPYVKSYKIHTVKGDVHCNDWL